MELQHSKPAWKENANFVLGAEIVDPIWSKKYNIEQLAAHELEDNKYEICCIPFMIYNLCLGDVVSVDSNYNIKSVIEFGGHFCFRVVVEDISQQSEVINSLYSMGNLVEIHSDKLFAVDAADEPKAQELANFLKKEEDKGILKYETGKI
jgi:hypothetical protein